MQLNVFYTHSSSSEQTICAIIYNDMVFNLLFSLFAIFKSRLCALKIVILSFVCGVSLLYSPTQHLNYESHLLLLTTFFSKGWWGWGWIKMARMVPSTGLQPIKKKKKNFRNVNRKLNSCNFTHIVCLTRLMDREASIWHKLG